MKTAQLHKQSIHPAMGISSTLGSFGGADSTEMARLTQIIARQQVVIERLETLARHDSLTTLLNRRGAEEALHKALSSYRRYAHTASILLLDLNKFKPVNDLHGHAAGDAVLRHVAKILGQSVRAEDVVARLGGDEFMVILRECTRDAAVLKARALATFIARAPCLFMDRNLTVGVSIGVVDVSESFTAEGLLAIADERMYAAKAASQVSR